METDILIKEATRLRLSEDEMLVLTVDRDRLLDDEMALKLRIRFADALDISIDRVLILSSDVLMSVVVMSEHEKQDETL